MNPIFRDQIDTKYIEFPEDMQKRLVIAAGGHKKVTASMQILLEYLLREISASRYSPQINEDKLPYMLGLEKYVKQNRKKAASRTHRKGHPSDYKPRNNFTNRKITKYDWGNEMDFSP